VHGSHAEGYNFALLLRWPARLLRAGTRRRISESSPGLKTGLIAYFTAD
jgi:hypothetical protein